MSDLVLRAAGHAVCAASLALFALIFGLATLSTANAKSVPHGIAASSLTAVHASCKA